MNWSTVLLYLSPLFLGLYFYVRHRQSYWARKGVTGPPPWFLFGNIVDLFRTGLAKTELLWLQQYGKVYGNYIGLAPVLTIAEPSLIKQVLISDFHLFINRRELKFEHEIWNKNLFLSESDSWKKIRSITSPTFTSGKLRGMNGLMSKCIDSLVRYLDKLAEKEGGAVMDTKEVISGFTIDVIASTSFATETNANDDRSEKSPFVYHGMNFFRSNLIKLVFMFTMPKAVNHFFNMRLMFPADSFNYFRNLTQTIVEQRKKSATAGSSSNAKAPKRNDLVQLLIDSYVYEDELKGGGYDKLTASMDEETTTTTTTSESNGSVDKSKKTLNDLEIIAQCMIFFVAGFETTATTITNIIYELALNPEIQERLKSEIESSLGGSNLQGADHQEEEYYETVNGKIPYLEAVIKEALRKYSPVTRLDRRLGDVPGGSYDLGGITLKKGAMVQVASYAVHHCPDFYPEPERFNPERFMPENRHKLVPYTYLPFGQGPRNCVGLRFAYQEIKLCLARVVPLFRFSPTPETPVPLVFNKSSLLLAINSLPIKVERRVT